MRAIKNVTSSWNWPNLSASNCCTCPPTRPTSISSNACGNSSRRIVCTRPITTTLRSSNRPSHLVSLKLKPHTGPPSTPCFPTASRPLKNQKLCQGRVYICYAEHMPATLIESQKLVLDDGAIIQIIVWRLPTATRERPRGLKYSLFHGRSGERIIGYDKETG